MIPIVLSLSPGLVTGETATYKVSGAAAGERVFVYASTRGTGSGPCPPAIGGTCLDLQGPVFLVGQRTAGPAGNAFVTTTPPFAAGTEVTVQAVVRRGPGGVDSVKSDPRTDEVYAHWDSGLVARPANATCLAPADPPVHDRSIALDRAFPSFTWSRPTEMVQPPGDPDHWWIAEKNGTIWRFDDDDATVTRTVVVDLTATVYDSANEMGLLGFAFHPDFATNGEVYLSYNRSSGGLWDDIVRYTSYDGGLTLDPASAQTVISIADPYTNHNGGKLAFGPDGYLYYAVGDGGGSGDPQGNAQDTFVELGKMLRLDVDSAVPYAIPPDNPFADGLFGLPEVYAWGLRNPWRWSFDRETGDLWLGDVGQGLWEEVDRIERGGNYGWDWKEGFAGYTAGWEAVPGLIDPVVDYDPGGSASVIGGYVYRGAAIPSLQGTYLFADYYTNAIDAVLYDADGAPYIERILPNAGVTPTSFVEDADGELYVLDDGGEVWRIVPSGAAPVVDDFPQWLSQTGCFDTVAPLVPAAGLVPYEPNARLWSDGADKSRWLAIPDGTTITVGDDGDWDLPVGSVLVKHFEVDGQAVETRLLVRHDDGSWAGYSYVWEPGAPDAYLAEGGASVTTTGGSWRVPSSAECLQCHTEAAGRTLGLETGQLNRALDYGGVVANQLSTLDQVGMFTAPLGLHPDQLAAIPDAGDLAVDEASRARGYLHANCSHCHRPSGPGLGDLDLRYTTADPGGCGTAPVTGDLGVAGLLVIDPGDAANSAVSLRMHATDAARMPPLGTVVVDAEGTALVDGWIDGLTSCP